MSGPGLALERFLIIATSGLGDTLSLLPMIAALKNGIPGVALDIVATHKEAVELMSGHLHGVIPLAPDWLAGPRRLAGALARAAWILRRRRPYTAALVTYPSGHWATAALALASGAPRRIGYPYPEGAARQSTWGLTETVFGTESAIGARNLALAQKTVPLPHCGEISELSLSAAAGEVDIPAGAVAIHPGGSVVESFKRWPVESFSRLAGLFAREGIPLVIVGGAGERETAARIAGAIGPSRDVQNLTGRLSLRETARVLARSRLLVANDSGVAHLAAAVGTPVVALFGPTSDVRYAPRGTAPVRVVARDLPCRPCYVAPRREPFACRFERELACLEDLSPEEVFAAALGLLTLAGERP